METMKCSKCDVVKPLTEFGNNQSTNTGGDGFKRPECKVCTSNAGKGKRKAWKRVGKPSAPPIGTNCDCCGKPPRPSTKSGSKLKPLVFDHGHISLNFRGWLCQSCNRAMGMLGDDERGMLVVLLYIAKSEGRPEWIIKKIEELLKDFLELGPPEMKSLMENYG